MFLFFVFCAGERKNEKQKDDKGTALPKAKDATA